MAKEGVIEFEGVVSELLPNAMFRVTLENEETLEHFLIQVFDLFLSCFAL